MKKAVGLMVLLTACRFGGSNGDALALVEPESDGGSAAQAEASLPADDRDGEGELPEDADTAPSVPDAAPDAAPDAGADADVDASLVDDCHPAPPRGCDLVRNTGCAAGVTQCIVDPESVEQVGRCVFTGLSLTPCSESVLGTSCPAQHACVSGLCRKYCYCDADCDQGSQCREPTGDAGTGVVMLCAAAQP